MLEFYILTFSGTNEVIKAEIELESIKGVRVIPIFPEIAAGCGLSIKVPKEALQDAKDILSKKEIKIENIYFRDEEKRITQL